MGIPAIPQQTGSDDLRRSLTRVRESESFDMYVGWSTSDQKLPSIFCLWMFGAIPATGEINSQKSWRSFNGFLGFFGLGYRGKKVLHLERLLSLK